MFENHSTADTENMFAPNEYEPVFGNISKKAVAKIERVWLSYRDRRIFKLLKHSICAAEHSFSRDVLKKVSPLESTLLNDPCLDVKIKFRFAGKEFPPYIVFKIYSQTYNGHVNKYINGKNSIQAVRPVNEQACKQMGNKQFYNLLILDSLQTSSKNKVTEQENVVSIRDFMQYNSMVDELPAYLGGKSNSWRKLNLKDLARHCIFYDILNYAMTKKMTKNLLKVAPALLKVPYTEDVQLEHIKILNTEFALNEKEETAGAGTNRQSQHLYKNNLQLSASKASTTSRRSKNALSKIAKMKRTYALPRSEILTSNSYVSKVSRDDDRQSELFKVPDELDDDYEEEVKDLYMWTQNLSIQDELIN